MLSEPLYWIASNAGYDGQAAIDQVGAMPAGHGLDALTGEFGDLYEKGIVDPVRVTRLSLEHAASVAALLLTTEALVAEELIAQPGRDRRARVRRPRRGPRAALVTDLRRTSVVVHHIEQRPDRRAEPGLLGDAAIPAPRAAATWPW